MAEDAKNPVCGDKETNMNPERGNTASCASACPGDTDSVLDFVIEEPEILGINITSNQQSVFVSRVKAGSLAERKGVRVGDEIIFVEPHVEDDPHPIESIEITRNQYNRFLKATSRPRSVSCPLVFKVRRKVDTSLSTTPETASEKTPVSKKSSVQTKVVSTSGVGVCSSSEHDAQSTQPKGTIDETQRHGRVPKHGRAKHGELLHHISNFLFTLNFTLSSPQPSFRILERIPGRTSTCLA